MIKDVKVRLKTKFLLVLLYETTIHMVSKSLIGPGNLSFVKGSMVRARIV
ncbi:hypothetical protein ACFQ5E_13115 [Oceanobacillus sojae]